MNSVDPKKLVESFPPHFSHKNKLYLYELSKETSLRTSDESSKDTDPIQISKWQVVKLPHFITLGDRVQTCRITHSTSLYFQNNNSKTGPAGSAGSASTNDSKSNIRHDAIEFHVDFANQDVFRYYGASLFSQEEVIVAEHPILMSVREYLKQGTQMAGTGLSPSTMDSKGNPTPILIMNALRKLNIYKLDQLYGYKFSTASTKDISSSCQRIPASKQTSSNFICMMAPTLVEGKYTSKELVFILSTACTSFIAARKLAATNQKNLKYKKPLVIHTGNWGCGPYGGNKFIMFLMQIIAANMSKIDELVVHTHSKKEFEYAHQMYKKLCSEGRIDLEDVFKAISNLGIEHIPNPNAVDVLSQSS